MHDPKTHFEQIPVETVKKIATRLPEKEFPGEDAIGDDTVDVETEQKGTSPQERWRDVAQDVQREEDPKKIVGLVQQLIATLDDEQVHRRLPHTRDDLKQSGDSRRGQS